MKKVCEGWIPQDEPAEETFSWIDPDGIISHDLKQAVKDWDRVKKVRVTVSIEEVRRPNRRNPHRRPNVPRRIPKASQE